MIRLSNSEYAALIAESDQLAMRADLMAEALAAATAYVELYTANGNREQPPAWAIKPNRDFDAEAIASRGRAELAAFRLEREAVAAAANDAVLPDPRKPAMNTITGEQHFTADFLNVYGAFKGELSPGDLAIGQQWFLVWQAAQQSMREALGIRAVVGRRDGRLEVADAIRGRGLKMQQTEVNDLASRHGLTPRPIEIGSDGQSWVILEKDDNDDRYYQVSLRTTASGKVATHVGLYREGCIVNDGALMNDDLASAFEDAASRIKRIAASR